MAPATVTFLGIELNTLLLTIHLPQEKVAALHDRLHSLSSKCVCLRRDLEVPPWPPSPRHQGSLPWPPVPTPPV